MEFLTNDDRLILAFIGYFVCIFVVIKIWEGA